VAGEFLGYSRCLVENAAAEPPPYGLSDLNKNKSGRSGRSLTNGTEKGTRTDSEHLVKLSASTFFHRRFTMSKIRDFNQHLADQKNQPADPQQRQVEGIQQGLKKLGYNPGKIDGAMGHDTQEAIKKFQKDRGLKVDGAYNPETKAALFQALLGQAQGNAAMGMVQGNVAATKAKVDTVVANAHAHPPVSGPIPGSAKVGGQVNARGHSSDIDFSPEGVLRAAADMENAVDDKILDGVDYAADKGVIPPEMAHAARKVDQVVQGARVGGAEIVGGVAEAVSDPIKTDQNMADAYHKAGGGLDGAKAAVNTVNPVYHGLVAGYETVQALERGDLKEVGRQGIHFVDDVVATVGLVEGGLAAGRAMGAGGGAIAGTDGAAGSTAGKPPARGRPLDDTHPQPGDPWGDTQPSNRPPNRPKAPEQPTSPHPDVWEGTEGLPPSPGDGVEVEIADAINAYRHTPDIIKASAGPQALDTMWNSIKRPKPAPRPVAFQFSHRIWIDASRITEEQRAALGVGPRVTPLSPLDHTPLKNPPKKGQAPAESGAPAEGGSPANAGQTADSAVILKNAPETGLSLDNDLGLVQKYAAGGGPVHQSVSATAHLDAWKLLDDSHRPPAPIAFQVDKRIYVDMSRWPKNMAPPKFK
jgi:Putative peptidoglycan binding domain